MSEPLQYACDEHGWCGFKRCPECQKRKAHWLRRLVSWRLKYIRLINANDICRNDRCLGVGIDPWIEDELLVRVMLWWWDICIRLHQKPAKDQAKQHH